MKWHASHPYPVKPVPTVTTAPWNKRAESEAEGPVFRAMVCFLRGRLETEASNVEDGLAGSVDPSTIKSYAIPPVTDPRRSID